MDATEAHPRGDATYSNELLRLACAAEPSDLISPATLRARMYSWRLYCQWADQERVAVLEADTAVGERYLKFLEGMYPAPASVMNRLAQTRALYLRWRALDLTLNDPFDGLQPRRNDPANRRVVFSPEQLKRLLKTRDAEAQALLQLGLHFGLKAEVVVGLDWENLDLKEGLLMTETSTELLRLPDKVRRVLSAFAEHQVTRERSLTGRVFSGLTSKRHVDQYLQRLCLEQAVQPRSWYVLRTTAGIQNSGRQDLKAMQQQMDFASVRSVQYLNQRQRLDQGEPMDGPKGLRPRRLRNKGVA